MKATRLTLIVCGLALTLASAHAAAQGFQGAVRGLVKDGGGVVPGAEVVLFNEATTVARSTTGMMSGFTVIGYSAGDETEVSGG